jgi:hypothetical protein
MEWSNAVSLRLIDLYRGKELLWNPTHDDYKSKLKKLDAWNEISQSLSCEQIEVRKKIESLLTSFRRERQNKNNSSKYHIVFNCLPSHNHEDVPR